MRDSAVCFDLRGVDVDTLRFALLIEDSTTGALEEVVKLYRGELLRGWDEPWLLPHREDLQVGYLDALKGLAEHALQAGSSLRAAYYLRRFVNGCPSMEWGWENLIRAYLQAGDRIQALQTYEAYGEFLRRENRTRKPPLHASPRIETLIRQAMQEEQTRTVTQLKEPSDQTETPPTAPAPPAAMVASTAPAPTHESVGGAVPLGSRYYIERPQDGEVYAALSSLAHAGSTVLIKGPRQIGKSSLLARALHHARQQNARVLLTNWQNLSHAELDSAESFFLGLARTLTDQLDLDTSPEEVFLSNRPPSANFERFLRRHVFPVVDGPLVWGIDEADRLFACDFSDDVFGKFRAWHNERALDPAGPWQRLSLILSYSTEASLFIKNLNQSPFNVGTRITLADLSPRQAEELNARYQAPLSAEEVTRLYQLIGGHPYLMRRALSALAQGQDTLATLMEHADEENGLFHDHLERLRFTLLLNPELAEAVRQWLKDETPPGHEHFVRLCAAGVMTGRSPADMRARCPLYGRYLLKVLQ